MGMFFRIAVRNLRQAKLRTLFLALALSLVTGLLMLLLALSQGVTDTIIRSATTLSSGHVNVAGWFKAKASDAAPLVTDAKTVRQIVEENTPGLDFVIDRARGWARVISDTSSLNAGLTGVTITEETRLLETLRLAEEREYVDGGSAETKGSLEALARPDSAMIFAAQAKRLEVGVGDVVTVTVETTSGARNTAEFTIVAVAKDIGMMSNWNVFLSKAGIRKLYALEKNVTGAIQIYLVDHTQSTAVMGHLQGVLEKAGYELMEHDPQAFWAKFETVAGEDWTGQKLDLTIWSDEVSFLTWVITAINSVSFLLITALVVIIVIGIMNSMWMSVRERTGEVGTLRAIGMSRRRVMLMFLLEALILAVIATIVGGLGGMGLAALLDAAAIGIPSEAVRTILMSDTLHMVVSPGQLVVAVSVFASIAALAAAWPAYSASRLQPVTAIQRVN